MTQISKEEALAMTAEIKEKAALDKETFLLVKQNDGNWRGLYGKNEEYYEARQGDPNTVLQLLLTKQ